MKSEIVADVLARPEVRARLDGDVPTVVLYDLDALDAEARALVRAFPDATLHTIAMKAAPLPRLLAPLVAAGLGLEVASRAELAAALQLAPAARIVHDGVAKLDVELAEALAAGVLVHAEDLDELDRIGGGRVGLRVNTGVGPGRVAATSTATAGSPFGVDVTDGGDAVVAAFVARPWLRGLHQHVGSLGFQIPQLVEGARRLAALADRIEAAGGAVTTLDLGGGLPVSPQPASYADYAEALAAAGVFARPVITELGRRLLARAGWVATRVHATRRSGGRDLAVVHAGADLFVTTALASTSLRLSVHGADGAPRGGATRAWDVCGPSCFAADKLAKARALPEMSRGDHVVVHDAGAYTLSMWSRVGGRPSPAVLGHRGDGAITVLREAETVDDVVRFWR